MKDQMYIPVQHDKADEGNDDKKVVSSSSPDARGKQKKRLSFPMTLSSAHDPESIELFCIEESSVEPSSTANEDKSSLSPGNQEGEYYNRSMADESLVQPDVMADLMLAHQQKQTEEEEGKKETEEKNIDKTKDGEASKDVTVPPTEEPLSMSPKSPRIRKVKKTSKSAGGSSSPTSKKPKSKSKRKDATSSLSPSQLVEPQTSPETPASKSKGSKQSSKKKKKSASGNKTPPSSPTRDKKKKRHHHSPTTPEQRKRRDDVDITSVHVTTPPKSSQNSQEEGDVSERTDVSEITTPPAVKKKFSKTGTPRKDKDGSMAVASPISPTEETTVSEDEDSSSVSFFLDDHQSTDTPKAGARGANNEHMGIPSVPNLQDSMKHLMTTESKQQQPGEINAVPLPRGPLMLVLTKRQTPPVTIARVRPSSPLYGIIQPRTIVLGLNLLSGIDGTDKEKGTTTSLTGFRTTEELHRALVQSRNQPMRLLWVTTALPSFESSSSLNYAQTDDEAFTDKPDQMELSSSWITSMSILWRKNNQARSTPLTATSTLISLPSTSSMGLQLKGRRPPMIEGIRHSSPLHGLLDSDVISKGLYVERFYSSVQGEQWKDFSASHLMDLLQLTSKEPGRMMVVTTKGSDDEEVSLSMEALKDPNRSGAKKDGKDESYTSTTIDLMQELARSLTQLSDSKSSALFGVDRRRAQEPSKHIIVKKTSRPSVKPSIFRKKTTLPTVISFHGTGMDNELADTIQRQLDAIRPVGASGSRLILSRGTGEKQSQKKPQQQQQQQQQQQHYVLSISQSANQATQFDEDAMAAIMDAMASAGWNLRFPLSESSDVALVFCK